jgi:hypothetical protein
MEAHSAHAADGGSAPPRQPADLEIGASLRDAAKRHEFSHPTVPVATVHWRMRDVTLYPPLALAFRSGEPVNATRYCAFDAEVAVARERIAHPRFRFDGVRAFMGFNRPHTNHFHTITQIVPAIVSYQSDPGFRGGALLMPHVAESAAAAQELTARALELAGVEIPRVVKVGGMPVDIGDLTFSSELTSGPSAVCGPVFDHMIRRARAVAKPATARAIYIWRADTQARPLLNEEQLIVRLASFGVEPVVLSLLSLDEQIILFREARLVIGPHGAGLTNVVFSRPGSVLYELLPSHYLNPCIARLARMRDLHYWCDVHPAEDSPGTWRHQVRWSVNVDAVVRRVAEIMARYPISG